jgi:ribosomal protein S16
MTFAEIVAAFGGTRPMARKTGINRSTLSYWKLTGNFPSDRIDEIVEAAKEHRVDVIRSDFE